MKLALYGGRDSVRSFKMNSVRSLGDYTMDLAVQFGWGMMAHSRTLVEEWLGGLVVLSPRDLSPRQMERLASDINAIPNGKVAVDPQFYLPNSVHTRLNSHDYWPDGYESSAFWNGGDPLELMRQLYALNIQLRSSFFILPGMYGSQVTEGWLERHQQFYNAAVELEGELELWLTLALGAEVLIDPNQIERLISWVESFDAISGVYVVAEHPNGNYLVEDPRWFSNLLDLVAGLRLDGKQVGLGYSNQQMLFMACAGANWIASGTWMNVRAFPPEKFRGQYEDEIRRRALWFYAPHLLSEFKVSFLDIAFDQGDLNYFELSEELSNSYSDALFQGARPSSTGFGESESFRHYLNALKYQAEQMTRGSFLETVEYANTMAANALRGLESLHALAINGQNRDFLRTECNEACNLGIRTLTRNRGSVLGWSWGGLHS